MLQDPKVLEKLLSAFGDRSRSNILMRFVVIVVGKCCFIETKTSCSEIVPLITFPWESFQSFWGQFISREGSKQEPWSSQSENRCFNGNNNKKPKPFRGSVWKVWFLFHTGIKTHFQTSKTFMEVHCWSLAASARNFMARQRRGWHVGLLLVQPRCGHTWTLVGISPIFCCSLLFSSTCPEASGNAEELPDLLPFFLRLLKCAKWFTKNKKSFFGPRSSHLGEMQPCASMGNEILSPNKTTE